MKFFPGIGGAIVTLALIASALACQPIKDAPAGQGSGQMTQVGLLRETKSAVEENMLTQVAPWVANNLPMAMDGTSFSSLATKVMVINTQIEGWNTGKLQYYEDFEDQSADGIEITPEQFVIVPNYGGNSFWQSTGSHSISKIQLPAQLRYYVVEFRIQALNGSGVGGIFLGDRDSNCPDYEISITTTMIRLSERDPSCLLADYHEFPTTLTNSFWHDFRVEVRQNTIDMYLDGSLQYPQVNGDEELLSIDTLGFWTCCDHLTPYTFLFDDIQVWRP